MQEQRFVDGIPVTGYFYTGTGRERIQHDHHMSSRKRLCWRWALCAMPSQDIAIG
jgi:hypothetical protein